ncbi:hypothetical protein ISF_07935 [Cordyceps fumosorosea ARSEF 2679]|uniref:F-box domain-containing protein n=1 Tax=Cordyceps fumosorosea (strain ARSEF 2679) TaxID=1081104 RepID=A0A167NDD8_CORFA|nr:hypothetical protein ISF_07935 [Cordyceps fumosorosea ARSEF 2679]OAA55424.1 hypothetical protein ISF_07935 [Cordyceps fumosorosea ARSEF 2679]
MVQWLADPATHAQRSAHSPRDALPPKRPARRGYSVTDFQGDIAVPDVIAALQAASLTASPSSPSTTQHIPTEATIPENAVLRTTPTIQQALAFSSSLLRPPPPKTKQPPRRSYSATDKEPEDAVLAPNQPRPGPSSWYGNGAGGLLGLPPELHYTLFDFLDPIDAVCFGLAHPTLYAIHRRKNGRVPLGSRYNGPNDLEWVWRDVRHIQMRRGGTGSSSSSSANSGSTSPSSSPPETQPQQQRHDALDKLRVKGQVYCRKCGIARCELHRHIRRWMGDDYEYCEVKERFAQPAPAGARAYCFMSSPKDRRRCGRHGPSKAPSSASTPVATTPPATADLATSPWV